MFKKIFLKAGLSPTQAEILEYLYGKKEDKASEIAKNIKKSRAIVYKDLDELAMLNIIEKIDKPSGIAYFRIGHPTHMEKFFDKKESEIKKDRQLFNNYLPDMVSNYNLVHSKPGVKFYEGFEGIKRVLWDTLTAKETIMSYSDVEAIDKFMPELNKEYVARRNRLKIKKRAIILDTPFARKFLENYFTDITENRFIASALFPFNTIMQIYDSKVSYITLSQDSNIGVIIEDKNIYQMHRSVFEDSWSHAKTLEQLVK